MRYSRHMRRCCNPIPRFEVWPDVTDAIAYPPCKHIGASRNDADLETPRIRRNSLASDETDRSLRTPLFRPARRRFSGHLHLKQTKEKVKIQTPTGGRVATVKLTAVMFAPLTVSFCEVGENMKPGFDGVMMTAVRRSPGCNNFRPPSAVTLPENWAALRNNCARCARVAADSINCDRNSEHRRPCVSLYVKICSGNFLDWKRPKKPLSSASRPVLPCSMSSEIAVAATSSPSDDQFLGKIRADGRAPHSN